MGGSRVSVVGNHWVTRALLLQSWHRTQWPCALRVVHLRGEGATDNMEAYLPAELLSAEHRTAPRSTGHTWANTDLLACLFLNSNNNLSFKGGNQFTGLVTQSGIQREISQGQHWWGPHLTKERLYQIISETPEELQKLPPCQDVLRGLGMCPRKRLPVGSETQPLI